MRTAGTPGLIGFDLDGTLVDSAFGIHASLEAACRAVALPPPSLQALRRQIGPPLRDYLPVLLGLSPSEAERLIEPLLRAFRMHHDQEGWRQFRVYDGALELLQTLEEGGWRLHVVTHKPAPIAEQMLRQSGLARHLCWPPPLQAPEPGAWLDKADALRRLCDPRLAAHWYVGDTPGDQRAAVAAGFGFVEAGYGYGQVLVAEHRLSRPLDLLAVLGAQP